METTVWFRNPDGYARELVDSGECRLLWDRKHLVKKDIEPNQWAELYFNTQPWEAMVIGNAAVHIDADHTLKNPKAVYPVWKYGDEMEDLEEICANPPGEVETLYNDLKTPVDERPIKGQAHLVVITDMPVVSSGPGRRFLKILKEMHEDYPDVIFHMNGLFGFRAMFGMGFGSADVEPTMGVRGGDVMLPAGSQIKHTSLIKHPQWVRILGFNPVDLEIPRNRTIFNIKSAIWAGKFWDSEISPKTRGIDAHKVDTTTPEAAFYPPTTAHPIKARVGAPGDKVICDDCSLAVDCNYYRAGSACGVPKTETQKLAQFFGTRDANDIIDGLTVLVKKNAERLDTAMEVEQVLGDKDPTLDKHIGQLFDQGVKLAKLMDPSLRGGPRVQVNVGAGGQAAVQVGDTRQMVSQAMRELEAQGIKREDITPAMIEAVLTRGMTGGGSAQPERVPIRGELVRSSHPDLPLVPDSVSPTERTGDDL